MCLEQLEEKLEREKIECRLEFMAKQEFNKLIVIGVLALVGLLGSSVAWAMADSSVQAKHGVIIDNNTKRIEQVEGQMDRQHGETMKILSEIKEKVSR